MSSNKPKVVEQTETALPQRYLPIRNLANRTHVKPLKRGNLGRASIVLRTLPKVDPRERPRNQTSNQFVLRLFRDCPAISVRLRGGEEVYLDT